MSQCHQQDWSIIKNYKESTTVQNKSDSGRKQKTLKINYWEVCLMTTEQLPRHEWMAYPSLEL